MAKPIAFGDFQFKTKKSAREEIQNRINSYDFNEELSPEDIVFFSELFKLHDEHQIKVGCGIKTIFVKKDFHNNRCLFIQRVDNTEIDISWVHCLQPASIKQVVSMAFRRAVKQSIMDYKSARLETGVSCPKLKVPLNFKNSHVVYTETSFDKLLESFLLNNQLVHESVQLINPEPIDEDQRGIIAETKLFNDWQKYHSTNAKLDLWSAKANLMR